MADAEANIIIRVVKKENDNMQVTQTEEAVKDNQPIKKGF